MRFNARRIARGVNTMRHAATGIVRNAVRKISAASSSDTASPKKAAAPKPKSLAKTQKPTQSRFKLRVRQKANTTLGPKGKPVSKQQRVQAGSAAMANWRKKRANP